MPMQAERCLNSVVQKWKTITFCLLLWHCLDSTLHCAVLCNISLYRDTPEAMYQYIYTLYHSNCTVYATTNPNMRAYVSTYPAQ